MTAPALPAPRTEPRPLAALEWLKLLASLGIVAFHLEIPGGRVGYGGLPVFLLLTTALAARSARGRSFAEFGAGRLRRLLLPWFAWSAFYAGLQCVLAAMRGQPLDSWPRWSMLLVGTYAHLWYLPFAALATLAVGRFAAAPGRAWPWAAAGLAALPVASLLLLAGLPEPLPQWAFVAPAGLLGLAFAQLPLGTPRALPAALGLALANGLVALGLHLAGYLDIPLPYSVGVGAAALAVAVPSAAGARTLRVTRAAFGVYLLHPFVALALLLLLQRTGTALGPVALLAATFFASLAAAMLLRATPLRRIL